MGKRRRLLLRKKETISPTSFDEDEDGRRGQKTNFPPFTATASSSSSSSSSSSASGCYLDRSYICSC